MQFRYKELKSIAFEVQFHMSRNTSGAGISGQELRRQARPQVLAARTAGPGAGCTTAGALVCHGVLVGADALTICCIGILPANRLDLFGDVETHDSGQCR